MTPQQRGGSAKTKAKADAARENGKRGGRPIKRLSIKKIETRPNYTLILTLSDGRRVERCLAPLAERAPGVMRVIQKKFASVKLIDGAPTWPGRVDLSPFELIYGPDWLSSRRVPQTMEL